MSMCWSLVTHVKQVGSAVQFDSWRTRFSHESLKWSTSIMAKQICTCEVNRAVASLTLQGEQAFNFPHFFLKFWSIFLSFPQIFFIFFLILVLRVGDSPTRKGPGYVSRGQCHWWISRCSTVTAADCFKFPRKWITVYKVFYWIISLLYSLLETSH